MPLTLTPAQLAGASTLSSLRAIRSCDETASRHLDAIIDGVLALPSVDVAAFANIIGPTDLQNLLTAHAQQCAARNALAQANEQIIAAIEAREPSTPRLASPATLTERLAAQGREMTWTDGVCSVSEPEPTPEPEPEI